MITFFSTPKPFAGHIEVIQRNAILSWKRAYPEADIILIGDDLGTAKVCRELGLVHVKKVNRNQFGTKYLASVYDSAQEMARHGLLCYVNCDIVLMDDFRTAVGVVARARDKFLMAGRRWDVDLRDALDFKRPLWGDDLRHLAVTTSRQRPAQWIDYFVFSKGLFYRKIPEFLIGRPGWDNWLLWFARDSGVPIVDASESVCAIHQNHDYSYHPDGEKGVWEGEEAQDNYRLLNKNRKFCTLEDATYKLRSNQLRRNPKRWFVKPQRWLRSRSYSLWFFFLDLSRPVRHRLGLSQKAKI
jgi:hypothetical protein